MSKFSKEILLLFTLIALVCALIKDEICVFDRYSYVKMCKIRANVEPMSMELCKKRLEILRTVPECPLNVWKYRGTIRNTCKMFGNVPEQSGMPAKCLEMFQNNPKCPQNVWKCSGTFRGVCQKFSSIPEQICSASNAVPTVMLKLPQPSQAIYKDCGSFR